ncbi:MAG: phosphotransferase [Myxococcota bacterium]
MRDGEDSEGLARRVLEAAGLPQPRTLPRARDGIANHVYLADDAVVRLGTGSDAAHYGRSVAVMRAAARATLAVPEVLFSDLTQTRVPVRVMVLARAAGVPLRRRWADLNRSQRLSMMHAVAEQAQRLHAIDMSEFEAAALPSPWHATMMAELDGWLSTLPETGEFPRAHFEVLRRCVEADRATLDVPRVVVAHNDLHWGNIIVDGPRLTALLDFDDTMAGPPELDAWGLLRAAALDDDPWIDPRALTALPDFELDAPGVLARARLFEAHGICEHLSGRLSWTTPAESLADALESFDDTFVARRTERALDALYG